MKTKLEAIAELESCLTKWPDGMSDVYRTPPVGWRWVVGFNMNNRPMVLRACMGDGVSHNEWISVNDVKFHVIPQPVNDDKLIEMVRLMRSMSDRTTVTIVTSGGMVKIEAEILE
jgi:hypothetical protein